MNQQQQSPTIEGLGSQLLVQTTIVKARDTLPLLDITTIWPLTSADRLTLETGYALDTLHVFNKRLDVNKLKTSLSILLQSYTTFGGRYDSVKGGILMNDEGVPFTIAHDPDWTVEKIKLHEYELEPNRFIDYSSSIIGMRLGQAPLMRVKLTQLADGGSALGICATHGVCDGETFYTLVNNWAQLCKEQHIPTTTTTITTTGVTPTNKKKPVLDQSQTGFFSREHKTKADVQIAIKQAGWEKIDPLPAAFRLADILFSDGLLLHHFERTQAYVLSAGAVNRIKYAAEIDAKTRKGTKFITSNEALSSFLCQLMCRLFDFPEDQPCSHSTMLNWRGRFPNMSLDFAGNASSAIKTCDYYAGSPLGIIAASMHEGLEPLKGGETVTEHVNLFLDVHHAGIAGHMADPASLPYLSKTPSTVVTNNFARYPIYDADFGMGIPAIVVPHHCGDQIVIFPTQHKDGSVALYFQGSTAIRVKNLSPDSQFFTELYKFDTIFKQESDIDEFFSNMSSSSSTSARFNNLSPISVGRVVYPENDSNRKGLVSYLMDYWFG
jgi:hypothetical protein